MPSPQPRLFPVLDAQLTAFGERLRLARLRRHFTVETVCARADIARATLYRAEAGDPAVSLGTYARILRVLGLDGDLARLAGDDVLGRRLQDLELPARRSRRKKSPAKDEGHGQAEG